MVPEQRNKKILDVVRENNFKSFPELLDGLDADLVKGALAGEHFQELFFENATNEVVIAKVKEILGL